MGNQLERKTTVPPDHSQMSPSIRLQLHGAIYCPDSFVMLLRYCANLKAIGYEPTSLNRINRIV